MSTKEQVSTKEQEVLMITILSQVCLKKLEENRHKSYWGNMPIGALFELLEKEIVKLRQAIIRNRPVIEIWRESANIANFAAFIADNYEADKEVVTPPGELQNFMEEHA